MALSYRNHIHKSRKTMAEKKKEAEIVDRTDEQKSRGSNTRSIAIVVVVFALVTMLTSYISSKVDESKTRTPTRKTITAVDRARNVSISKFKDEIATTTSIERLQEIYAIYMPDGSLNNEIFQRMEELGASSDAYSTMDHLRNNCKFYKYPEMMVLDVVIPTYGEWSNIAEVGNGNKWKSCSRDIRKFDMRADMDDNRIFLYSSSGSPRTYLSVVQWRLNKNDSNWGMPSKIWVKLSTR